MATLAIRISNLAQILDFDENFFENVTDVYLGGVVLSNPRPFSMALSEVA